MRWVLESARIRFREMSGSDIDYIASLLEDPDVMRFWPRCYTRLEAEAWVNRMEQRYARDGHGYWLALDRATGEPLGQAGLLMCDVDGVSEPSLGYIVDRRFWRKGLATEAAAAIRDHAFDVLDKPRVIALIRPENIPSQGVALKIGMKPSANTVYAGFDHIVFSVARAERKRMCDGGSGTMQSPSSNGEQADQS